MNDSNIDGSGKASSYVRALDLLGQMILEKPQGFADCTDIWNVSSTDRLEALRLKVLEEQKKGKVSVWNLHGIPKSYLTSGYCSAALRSYQRFLVEHFHEQHLLNEFHQHSGSSSDLAERLDQEVHIPEYLQLDYRNLEGTDVVQSVTVRRNQNVFRKIILEIYDQSCCITGLNIPTVNRASHIVPWSEDKANRMNPSNGLCLSATYDAAFDKNLISLDDDYRIILSKDIKEHFNSQSVTEYFLRKEGQPILLPKQYEPNRSLLARHRERGNF
ncbi:HNH endonuclease [Endozoicomonas numazuensis]|uniref:HNH endonuclease n=1 Tax=Endozoicomonas numazuensis TaxID=1137799 RepID=UPI001378DECD|nr:HNH endonuclease [Endozoicomonas numazuensis]